MIGRAGVGDAETHRDVIEKANLGERRRLGSEIIADEENDFVQAGLHFIGGQQREVGAAIGVGFGAGDERAFFAVERPEFDLQTGRGAAVGGVENVRAEFGGHKFCARFLPGSTLSA